MAWIDCLENCLPATQDDEQVDRNNVPAHGVGEISAHGVGSSEMPPSLDTDTSTIQSDPEKPSQMDTTVPGAPIPTAAASSDVDSFSSLMDDWEEVQSLARTSSTIVVDFHEASDVDTGPS